MESTNKPSFEEWKKHVLSVKHVNYAPIDDFEEYQSVFTLMFWRIRIHFRPWKPFHLRFLFWTNERLEDYYASLGQGYAYPVQVDILRGEWTSTREW